MAMNKSEQARMKKLEADVEYWKKKAGIIKGKRSALRWSDWTNTVHLVESGHIQFDWDGVVFSAHICEEGIDVSAHSPDGYLAVMPRAANHVIVTIKDDK